MRCTSELNPRDVFMSFFLKIKRIRKNELVASLLSYRLFLLFPLQYHSSKGEYFSDDSEKFTYFLKKLKQKPYKKAIILGNAPCLSELSEARFSQLKESALTIGLNRSIYSFQPDILLWSDIVTIYDVMKGRRVKDASCSVIHVKLERNYWLKPENDINFKNLIDWWKRDKSFRQWNKNKLFMFRNILLPALHLCYRLDIRDVELVGFGFDNRHYFYQSDQYQKSNQYEIKTKLQIEKSLGGYDTQSIVSEVLEYLVIKENFKISFLGDSRFLKSLPFLSKVEKV